MIGQRIVAILLISTIGFAALAAGVSASASPTGFTVAPEFQSFYAQSGGLSNFGYAIGAPTTQSGRLTQYFERQRFENHPELAGTPYQVELGRLGVDFARSLGLIQTAPFVALPPTTSSDATCTFFAETGHRLCVGFRDYWNSNGVEFGDPGVSFRESLALFGYPISEEFRDPKSGLTVQYFERARFEYHPEFAGTKYAVELTLLGQDAMNNATATNSSIARQNNVASSPSSKVLFGVYPGGGNGEVGYVAPPSADSIVRSINQLRGDAPFNIHLYTAWSWYNQQTLDNDVARYSAAGLSVTLTIKYSPPDGHSGDVTGFAKFVHDVVARYGSNTRVNRFVIGNEINVTNGNPGSSDGPITGVRNATIQGVLAAKSELNKIGSQAHVGTDIAVLDRNTDAQFLHDLVQLGGQSFRSSLSFIGINVYPGLWPVGNGDPYGDMSTYLSDARYALNHAGLDSNVTLDVLENGYPTLDENQQADRLTSFVKAICDNASALGITGYSWFDLWDANSSSTSMYGHYGLFRSDLSPKPAFTQYQKAISRQCSGN